MENLFERLVLFGLLPFTLLSLVGEELFTVFLGKNWAEAGVYAQILSLSIFFRFISGPASYLVLIFEKQEISFVVKVLEIVVGVVAIAVGGVLGNVYVSFLLLSGLTGLLYAVYGFWFMSLAGLHFSKALKIIWHFLLGKEGNNKLDKLFELAPSLKDCYNLREELYEIFELEGLSKEDAKDKIDRWCKKANKFETKGFNPFTSFTKTYGNFEHIDLLQSWLQ